MDNFRDSYFQVDWDLTTKRLKGTYWGKQYDTGRGFAVTVINGGQVVTPSTEVLRLKWEKPDNTTGYVNATVVDGKFIVENIDQMFTVAGIVRADFELSVGGKFVASITFYVSVEKAVAVDAIESSSDFTALQDALADVGEVKSQLADKAEDADLVTERQRIDSFTSLQEGSTTGDAELLDARIGAIGDVYNNAGNAVRGQVDNLSKEIKNVFDVVESKQLLNYNTLKRGYYFDTVNEIYATSDYIKVTPGKRVYVYRHDKHDEISTNAWGIETYNADKTKQERIQLAAIQNYYDNENSSYIKVSGQSDYINLIAVEEDEQTINSRIDYTPPEYKIKDNVKVPNIPHNILDNKSLICCGDSITEGAGITDKTKVWGNLIAQRNNMLFTNAGISGTTMGVSVDGTDKKAFFDTNRHLAIKDHDYATIWFGWNDYNFCALGTVGSSDTSTTLGAYYATLNYVVRQSVETKIGVIIPYLWNYDESDPQGHSIMELINGIKETCNLFGVPYLDINKCNFLQSWGSDYPNDNLYYVKWDARQKVFTSDTLHPNEKGNEYLSTIIENFIKSL